MCSHSVFCFVISWAFVGHLGPIRERFDAVSVEKVVKIRLNWPVSWHSGQDLLHALIFCIPLSYEINPIISISYGIRYIQSVSHDECKLVHDCLYDTNCFLISEKLCLLAEARTAQEVLNMSHGWLGLFLTPCEQFCPLLAGATSHIYNEVSLAKPSSQNEG